MPIYKPSELFFFLETLGIKPKKSLSQNFLIDQNIVNKILQELHLEDGDYVLEIGPGPGVLTEALLEKNIHLIAVEKDLVFAQALERFVDPVHSPKKTLKIFAEDFLDFPLEEIMKTFLPEGTKCKIVSNLPYSCAAPILEKLCYSSQFFSQMTIMVQKEMAQRFLGKIGTKNYSSFTLFLQFYAKIYHAFDVSKNSFFPKPKVDSSVMTLVMHSTLPLLKDKENFHNFVQKSFQQRRKCLRSSIKELYPDLDQKIVEELFVKHHLETKIRAENLSLEMFLSLFQDLENKSRTPI
jgi:16S rRNA (adenine1518-N6/adenine1519-N6)-dimethyltransferase